MRRHADGGAGVQVLIRHDQTLTAHGALAVNAAGSFEIEDSGGFPQTSGIVVSGTMDAIPVQATPTPQVVDSP